MFVNLVDLIVDGVRAQTAAVVVDTGSSFVEISNNKFIEISGNGIVVLNKVWNISIINNEMNDLGKNGIVVSGYQFQWNTSLEYGMPTNIWIKWNKIIGIGRHDPGQISSLT